MSTEEFSILNSRRQELRTWIKNENNSTIALIFCHGFFGNSSGFIQTFSEYLGSMYLTCRFDFSGQGESEGDFFDSSIDNELDDLETIANYVRQNYKFQKIILIGHSFGAAVITLYAGCHSIDGYISISGEGNLKKAIPLEFNEQKLLNFETNGSALYENWSHNGVEEPLGIGFLHAMGKYADDESVKKIVCPGLFIHGAKDDTIPVSQTLEAYELFNGNKELYLIEGADHMYEYYSNPNQVMEVVAIIEKWLKKI